MVSQILKIRLKAAIIKGKLNNLTAIPHHGQFYHNLHNIYVENELTFGWLPSSGLKGETEGLIVATQDQALNTHYHQNNIQNINVDSKCWMCHQHDKTVSHIISG